MYDENFYKHLFGGGQLLQGIQYWEGIALTSEGITSVYMRSC